MAKQYKSVTPDQRKLLVDLQRSFGDKSLRTFLVPENREGKQPERTRIISRKRLGNLTAGSGKLTQEESETLELLKRNRRAIESLQKRGEKKGSKDFKTNRAVRTWLQAGRVKGLPRSRTHDEIRAIRALRFLDVDIDAGIFYLKGNAT